MNLIESGMLRPALVFLLSLSLLGCQHSKKPASIVGECHSFTDPGRVVKGKERPDQRWIDKQIETGIGVCGWPRPKP